MNTTKRAPFWINVRHLRKPGLTGESADHLYRAGDRGHSIRNPLNNRLPVQREFTLSLPYAGIGHRSK